MVGGLQLSGRGISPSILEDNCFVPHRCHVFFAWEGCARASFLVVGLELFIPPVAVPLSLFWVAVIAPRAPNEVVDCYSEDVAV